MDIDYRNNILNRCKEINEVVDHDLKQVSDIDETILDLINEHNYILYGLNKYCLNHNIGDLCLGNDPKTILQEYDKNHFNSEIVKKAIKNVRDLFFDDTDDRYKKFNCVQIFSTRTYSSNYIESISFIFEDDKHHIIKFIFCINDHKFNSTYTYESTYKYKILDNFIYFGFKDNNNYRLLNASFDPDVLKNSVKKLVDNNFIIDTKSKEYYRTSLQEDIDKIFDKFKYIY